MQTVRLVTRKWPDRPHWEFEGLRLGADPFGVWLGLPVGTVVARPGARFVTDQPQVTLVPRDAGFAATFHARHGETSPVQVYVDMTTVPTWAGETVSMVDLDLDVLLGWTGRVWVDDEDEFADHRVRYAYPDELVTLALESCASVRAAVESARPPYDGASAAHWLAMVDTGRIAREVTVHGHVQGVFFRDECRREAVAVGVTGWVRNEPDGTVRARFEGSEEVVETMLAWARHGPPRATVSAVEVHEVPPDHHPGFRSS